MSLSKEELRNVYENCLDKNALAMSFNEFVEFCNFVYLDLGSAEGKALYAEAINSGFSGTFDQLKDLLVSQTEGLKEQYEEAKKAGFEGNLADFIKAMEGRDGCLD